MTNIYVGNLPYAVQEEELLKYFRQWGPAERATLVFDRETGRPRGFGFVEMDDPEAAKTAIAEAHGKEFMGRPLTVNEARPRGSGRTGNTSGFAPRATSQPTSDANSPAPGYNNQSPPQDSASQGSYVSRSTSSDSSGGGGYSNQIYQ